jgi:hypothetical protein
MRVVEILDDCFTGMEDVGVIDVVEPQEEIVGSGSDVFVHVGDFRRIGAGEASPIRYCAVHADRRVISASPLTPTVVVLRLRLGTEMIPRNICQGLEAKIAAVLLVGWP